MAFVAFTQKTYPGYKQWTLGTRAGAFGWLLTMLRELIPEAASVMAGNLAFVGGVALIYGGTCLFLGRKSWPWLQVAVPVACMGGLAWFLWGRDLIGMRVMVLSLSLAALLSPAAWMLVRHAPRGRRALYWGVGGVIFAFCVALLVRGLTMIKAGPSYNMMAPDSLQAAFFFFFALVLILWTMGFIFINGQRVSDELSRAQAELAVTADSMERILDFLPDPTWVIDREGRVVFWNRAMEELTGAKAEEMLGKGDHEYSLPLYGERRPVLIDLVLRRDPYWESRYPSLNEKDGMLISSNSFFPSLGPEGTYLASTAACLYDEQGGAVGAIETVRDITQAELARGERETLISQLQDALDNVKTLKGLIPICSHCKSIRRDEGVWERLEAYIADHSEAEFSHGICPECKKKYYSL
eukprot:TRINITY_DN2385_c0_g5_i1.p2 TRINITY_DN2385_c0_g5~~TRINITY_DN2385_c0_g5_i1.p2  ORF type:complete len:412 (+),score=124.89 TRINITY_DN2385_c0_g5_i1:251-1486(+)